MTSTTIDRAAWRAHGPGWGLAAALLAPAAWATPFTINADGTATDAVTGLVWDRCYLGQSAAYCDAITPTLYTWQAALQKVAALNAQAGGYKGYTDWRLPNKNELESLVKLDAAQAPYIDTPAFDGTQPSGSASAFWSSTTYAPSPAGAWYVYFGDGSVYDYGKSNAYAVRLVRSGQSFSFYDALDTTAPAITAGPTVTPGADGTTASASVTVGEAATGFWQVLPTSSPAPDAATLQGTGTQVAMAAGVAASISLASLNSGTAYTLYFIAKDAAGNAPASVTGVGFTTANVPGIPAHVAATPGAPGSGTITLAWDAPAANGSTITGYTVTPPGTGTACTGSPCGITGLANAAQYTFAVQAANGVGPGTAGTSAAVWLQGTQSISFPVQGAQAYASGGTFAISPASATSGLTVAYGSATPAICTVAGTTVTMASAGTCTLTADQLGSSAWAAAPQATQPVTIGLGTNAITFPAQAGQTYATGGSFAISPVATGKSSQPVTYSSLSTGVCTVAGTTVTMLSAGTCTLAANQAADANWAAAPQATQTVQITATAPGAPTGVTATPSGPTQVTVRWTPPANDGGGITQYTVRALVNGQPSGQTCTAVPPVTQCTVTGLEPGKTYTFAVEATNGAGNTAAPAPTNLATPLADAKAFSAAAPTGTGTVAVAVAGGGNTCAFESVQLLPAASAGAPATRSFPHGVLDFVLNGCDATPVTLTVTYPPGTPLQGAQYWKRQGGAWAPFASAVLGVSTAVLTLVDGGTGDDDGAADGRIVDPGGVSLLVAPGPGGTATAIPTLGEWALALLAAVLGLLGVRQRRAVRA